MRRPLHTLTRCWRDTSGAALIEFLIVFPFVMLLLFGAIEMARYVMITQKVERAGYVLGDTLSQYSQEEFTLSTINTIYQQYFTMMNPYGGSAKQVVFLSAVTKDPADGQIKVRWQYVGGGTLRNDKTISVVTGRNVDGVSGVVAGQRASFSGDVASQLSTMLNNENMIIAEAFFQYQPIFSRLLSTTTKQSFSIGSRTLMRRTFFQPRKGNLNCPAGYVQSGSSTSSSSGGACSVYTCDVGPPGAGYHCCAGAPEIVDASACIIACEWEFPPANCQNGSCRFTRGGSSGSSSSGGGIVCVPATSSGSSSSGFSTSSSGTSSTSSTGSSSTGGSSGTSSTSASSTSSSGSSTGSSGSSTSSASSSSTGGRGGGGGGRQQNK